MISTANTINILLFMATPPRFCRTLQLKYAREVAFIAETNLIINK